MDEDLENSSITLDNRLNLRPGGLFAGPLICGVDEAGRGPLAGPVVAAAVILADTFETEGLDDSKRLSPAKREIQRARIVGSSCFWGIGVVEPEKIDKINILQASFMAMRLAIDSMGIEPRIVYVDGHLRIPGLTIPQEPLIRGDALKPCISAASILAKTFRDEIMIKYAIEYPQYGFERHKGYPTPGHLAMLKRHGPCPIHRKSFYPVTLFFEKLGG